MSTQPHKITANNVVFSKATDDQLTTVWTLNASAWAQPLSVEDHIKRERILSQQFVDSAWITWVLSLRNDPTTIVASVETFERPVIVSSRGAQRIEKGYGIASVFTNEQYRGNGMASVLLGKLKDWLDGEGEGWISVLYSDIGANFYQRLGWDMHPVKTLQIETDPSIFEQAHNGTALKLPGLRLLKEEELPTLCEQDSQALEAELNQSSADEGTWFAFQPKPETIAWHIKREDLNGSLIHGRWKTRVRGIISDTGRAWIVLHFDEIEHKLKIQRIVTLNKKEDEKNVRELAALIRFAQWVGKGSGFMSIQIWDPDAATLAAAELLESHYDQMQIKLEDRTGSLACARRRDGAPQDDLHWAANEYYAWC